VASILRNWSGTHPPLEKRILGAKAKKLFCRALLVHLKSIFIFAMAPQLGTLLLLKSAFEKWLEDENFDEYQQQRKRLEMIRESLRQ
jgi:hypothetical protein